MAIFGTKKKEEELTKVRSEELFRQGMASVLDLIAPAAFVVNSKNLRLGDLFVRTLFVYTYPRYLNTNWLSPIINYDIELDISMMVYPRETKEVMTQLRKKATQLESAATIEQEKGLIRNPELETAIGDVESLRDVLQRGELRLFQFAMYFTIYAKSEEELETITAQLESTLGGMLIYTKQTFLQMEQGFNSSLPLLLDELLIVRNLDTASLSTTFPFVSAELTTGEGVLYGLNRHNNSLVLFDRFNLENANSVVFGKAGGGKSFAIKLEVLRSLMLETDVIVIDPENEYQKLAEVVGGSYLNLSLNSESRINPFDIPQALEGESGEEVLRATVTTVHGLVSLMVGGLTPEEDALLDRGIYETYAVKDITADVSTHKNEPPLITDLEQVLSNITGAENLVRRLSKYTQGTFAGLFTKPTNFDLERGLVVFSVRDLEESLRPIAMYMILGYVWNKIRHDLRKRLMVIDEAWWMMQYPDSAKFLYSLAKRSRKYYLGLTIISQDVEDFLASQYGRAVVSNSSLQILLKQSPTAIDKVAEVFKLTEGEKFLLLESDVGEGLFFAGLNHVAIKIVASYTEEQIITTDPKALLAQRGLAAKGTPTLESPQAPNA
jgi:conjugal transfer ATP-binding protein TraC